MDLYMITGFLGAGKTTFIKELMKQFADQRIQLIINEFGKTGVDGARLTELGASMREISNGSIFCACRLEQFEDALAELVQNAPDVVLVETSGMSNPTNIRKILARPAYRAIRYQGSVCLVDAVRFLKIAAAVQVCPRQVAVASLVVVNKTDLAPQWQVEETEAEIRWLNPRAHVVRTEYGRFCHEWLAAIRPVEDLPETGCHPDLTQQKICLHITAGMGVPQMEKLLEWLGDATYRIKGFVALADGQTYLADCVGPHWQLGVATGPVPPKLLGKLNLMAGKGMPLRKTVKEAREWYGEYVMECEQ